MGIQLGLCRFKELQIAVWKGERNDDRLYYALHRDSPVHSGYQAVCRDDSDSAASEPFSWLSQLKISGELSQYGPALAVLESGTNATLVAVWAGRSNQASPNYLWSTAVPIKENIHTGLVGAFPGEPREILGKKAISASGVSIATDDAGTTLYAAWTREGTTKVYYATGTLDETGLVNWSEPKLVMGIASNTGVALFRHGFGGDSIWAAWSDAFSGELYTADLLALTESSLSLPLSMRITSKPLVDSHDWTYPELQFALR